MIEANGVADVRALQVGRSMFACRSLRIFDGTIKERRAYQAGGTRAPAPYSTTLPQTKSSVSEMLIRYFPPQKHPPKSFILAR